MSTELFEAKALADEIHHASDVPEEKNNEIYNITLTHIGTLILEMDRKGLTMDEQRTRMGKKKDELIGELKNLRARGILRGDNNEGRMAEPTRIHIGQIRVKRTVN